MIIPNCIYKMVRHYLDGASIVTCLNSLDTHGGQFKMWEVFLLHQVFVCIQCKQMKFDIYVLIPELILSCRLCLGVYHQPDVNLSEFRAWLEVSLVSSHTEELLYNETVYLCMAIYMLHSWGVEHSDERI